MEVDRANQVHSLHATRTAAKTSQWQVMTNGVSVDPDGLLPGWSLAVQASQLQIELVYWPGYCSCHHLLLLLGKVHQAKYHQLWSLIPQVAVNAGPRSSGRLCFKVLISDEVKPECKIMSSCSCAKRSAQKVTSVQMKNVSDQLLDLPFLLLTKWKDQAQQDVTFSRFWMILLSEQSRMSRTLYKWPETQQIWTISS